MALFIAGLVAGGVVMNLIMQDEEEKEQRRSYHALSLEKANPRPLQDTLKTLKKEYPGRKAKIATLIKQIDKITEKGYDSDNDRGKFVRGWGAAAPQRGTERNNMMSTCGSECFLIPERKAFPICAALREGKSQACKVDCRGLLAARMRAKQWNYPEVEKKAVKLGKEYGCEWAKDL